MLHCTEVPPPTVKIHNSPAKERLKRAVEKYQKTRSKMPMIIMEISQIGEQNP